MDSHAVETALAQQAFAWRAERVALAGSDTLALYRGGRDDPAAPVLLLVHGMGHWTQAAWTPLAAELARTHAVVAFDLPGFGESSKPDAPYTLGSFDDAVRRVVAHARLERFAIIGHSLGGLIAASYAAREPAHVRALGLIDPAGFLRTPKLALRVMAGGPVSFLLRRLRPSRGLVRRTLEQSVYDPASLPPGMVDDAYARFRDRAVARAFVRVYAGAMQELLHMNELHARLARWTGRTAIVWGRNDRFVPLRGLRLAQEIFPQADVLVLDRCGHCPAIEMPKAVAAFLTAHDI